MKLICLLFTITVLHFTARAQTFAWARSMGGPTTSYTPSDIGYQIKADSLGNVYTVGFFRGVADFDPGPGIHNLMAPSIQSGIAMFIQKLDSNGNFLWAKQFIGDSSSVGVDLELDDSLNIYVTGSFQGTQDVDPGAGVVNLTSTWGSDLFLLKLDVNGTFLWVKQIGGSAGHQGGYQISLDSDGNIGILGHFQSTADFDPGPGVFSLTSIGTTDIFVSKFNSLGNFIWAKQIGGSGSSKANSMSLDSAGNFFLTGFFMSTIDFDPGPGVYNLTAIVNNIFVLKLDVSGNLVWARQMTGNLGSYGYGINVDKKGNVFYSGSFWGTIDFDPGPGVSSHTSTSGSRDIFISKLDSSGNLVWIKQIGAKKDEESYSLKLDGLSNCYVTGYFADTVDFDPGTSVYNLIAKGEDDIFIQKLDSAGRFVWAVSFESNGSGPGRSWGQSIEVGKHGQILTTGMFGNPVDFDPGPGIFNLSPFGIEDIFVLKLTQTPCSGSPLVPGAIIGSAVVSIGQTISYSINPVPGAVNYQWSITGGGVIVSGQNTPAITVSWTSSGNYTLSVNAGNSCGTSNIQTLNVSVSSVTGVVNADNQFHIQVIPNPSRNDFYLKAKGVNNKQIKIEVVNILGQTVYATGQRATTNHYSYKLNFARLPASIYNIKVTIDKKTYQRSAVKLN